MRFFIYSLFLFFFLYPAVALGAVVVNEIAWMGTAVSANDEWVELYNNGNESVNLAGWRLASTDGQPDISFDTCVNTAIAAGGYFLLERTDDETVPGITTDCIYTGALGNASEHLQLLNASGSVVDSVNATDGWPAGDNTTKETMQRNNGGWLTAVATPKAVNNSNPPTNSGQDNNNNDTNTNGADSGSGSGNTTNAGGTDEPYVQPEDLPNIKASTGEDQSAAVGEQVQFHGSAWGLDNKMLENARYMWNFGDGATYDGQNVGHIYMFPGTYVVRLSVSSGKYSAFDDVRVVVGGNTIGISEVIPGETGWIEIQNTGKKSIHMGGWIIESSDSRFVVPLGTTIAPQSFAVLSAATTHVLLKSEGDHVYLFYPNGTYANGISYVFLVPQGKSISANTGMGVLTEPTPGSQNKVMETSVTLAPVPQTVITPLVAKTSILQHKASSPKVIPPTQEEKVEKLDMAEQKTNSVLQSATLADTPVLSKANREAYWFGASLILGGLAAVGVVLFRRRKNSMSDITQ